MYEKPHLNSLKIQQAYTYVEAIKHPTSLKILQYLSQTIYPKDKESIYTHMMGNTTAIEPLRQTISLHINKLIKSRIIREKNTDEEENTYSINWKIIDKIVTAVEKFNSESKW